MPSEIDTKNRRRRIRSNFVPRRFKSPRRQIARGAKKQKEPSKWYIWIPGWFEALAAGAIVLLTISIVGVTQSQRDISKKSNKILGKQNEIIATQSKIMESGDQITRVINRSHVYFDVGITPFKPKDTMIIGISLRVCPKS